MNISKYSIRICYLIIIAISLFQIIVLCNYTTVVNGIKEEVEQVKIVMEEEAVKLEGKEAKILELVNNERKQETKQELVAIEKLNKIAKQKAEDLEENKYFSHTSPVLGTPFDMLKKEKISYKIAGENLAGNTTETKAVVAWMNSESHKENILNEKYKYTGIGICESAKYGNIYAQIFMGIE